jgi:hypothetical protein
VGEATSSCDTKRDKPEFACFFALKKKKKKVGMSGRLRLTSLFEPEDGTEAAGKKNAFDRCKGHQSFCE